jgi:GntR family transcriptional repressor for pyruvate dehydrogenase complex
MTSHKRMKLAKAAGAPGPRSARHEVSPFDAILADRPQRKSAVKAVVDTIERLIITRQLRPGDRLPSETELTKSLATSRGTIREAIKILASFGIVEIRRGDGTYVARSMSRHLFDHLVFQMILSDLDRKKLMELREVIELGIVKLVIANASEDDLGLVEAEYRRMAAQVAEKEVDAAALTELDLAFHRALGRATQNELIQRVYDFTLELFAPSIEETHKHKRKGQNALRLHKAILDGLQARDARRAEEAVRESIAQWELYSQPGSTDPG